MKLRPAMSKDINRFLRAVRAGDITASEEGESSLRLIVGALENIARGVDPDVALRIARAPSGRPSEYWNWVLGDYVGELRAAGEKWAVIESSAEQFAKECGRAPVSLTRLKQLHKMAQGTEGPENPLIKAWDETWGRAQIVDEIYALREGTKTKRKPKRSKK